MNKNLNLSKSRRIRGTPYSSRIEKQGVKSYTVYNHPNFYIAACFNFS